ncbi:LEM domain-containing protein 1 [Glossophaga mutica]
MVDVKCLSDEELQNELNKLGFSSGPILSSTRKLYENKLIQLLVSPPCASPVKNGPGKQDGTQGCDDSKELNATIILKGNIILSSEKNKGPKKNPVFEIQEHQEELVKPNSWASRAPDARPEGRSDAEEKDCGTIDSSVGGRDLERFPVGVKLAAFVIFVIVIFVYITVEKKPLLG